MGVDGKGIQEKIRQTMATQMILDRSVGAEHEASRIDPAGTGLAAQIAAGESVFFHQPQHAAVDGVEQPHPDIEHERGELLVVVEAAENEALLRQSNLAPSRGAGWNFARRIIDLVADRKMDDVLGEEGLQVERQGDLVANDVVDERGPHRSLEA